MIDSTEVMRLVRENLLTWLLGVLALVPLGLFAFARDSLSKVFDPSTLSATVLALAIVVLLLVGYLLYQRSNQAARVDPGDYKKHKPDPFFVVYIPENVDPRKRNDEWFCARCMEEDRRAGRLFPRNDIQDSMAFECTACHQVLRMYKPPAPR